MDILTRPEEYVLLAVWRLGKDAYSVLLREHLMEITGKNWSFGAVYDPLERLEKKGYLESYLTEPQKMRGGRSKRIYTLTKAGRQAMIDLQNVHEAVWNGVTKIALEKGK